MGIYKIRMKCFLRIQQVCLVYKCTSLIHKYPHVFSYSIIFAQTSMAILTCLHCIFPCTYCPYIYTIWYLYVKEKFNAPFSLCVKCYSSDHKDLLYTILSYIFVSDCFSRFESVTTIFIHCFVKLVTSY